MKKVLKENTILILAEYDSYFETLCQHWSCIPYCELSVVVAALKALATLHQSHHWQSSGNPSYGDHLLFERIYNGAIGHVDTVAEKAVGYGGEDLVCPLHLEQQALVLLTEACSCSTNSISLGNQNTLQSLEAEKHFLNLLNTACESLKTNGQCTMGIENMLQSIADDHETFVYLLGQRTKS